jgi:hypothetical protein
MEIQPEEQSVAKAEFVERFVEASMGSSLRRCVLTVIGRLGSVRTQSEWTSGLNDTKDIALGFTSHVLMLNMRRVTPFTQ